MTIPIRIYHSLLLSTLVFTLDAWTQRTSLKQGHATSHRSRVTKVNSLVAETLEGRTSFKHRRTSISGHDHEAWKNGYTTCPEEIAKAVLDFPDLPYDFPVGTYFRNGHGRFESDDGVPVRHMFDGDGLISAITFDPARKRILFRNRFVRTNGYVNDKLTGTMSAPGIFGTKVSGGFFKNLFNLNFKNPANTNVLYANNSLYALWEADWPYRLNPLTLENDYAAEPFGHSFDGVLQKNERLSAHYRYDPKLDSVVDFGMKLIPADGTSEITLYEFDAKNMNPIRTDKVSAVFQGAGVCHDFALTENWCIFSLPPASLKYATAFKAMLGLVPFASAIDFQDATEARIVMIPRMKNLEIGTATGMKVEDDDRIKVINVPYHFAFHCVNAFEDSDGIVTFDLLEMPFPILGIDDMPQDKTVMECADFTKDVPGTKYVRYIIDPVTEKLVQPPKIIVQNRNPDFPTFPRNLSTMDIHYSYLLTTHKEFSPDPMTGVGSGPHGALTKVDITNPSNLETFSFLPHEFPGEPMFVPKVGADVTKLQQEDKGYVILQVIDGINLTTDLLIFDVEGKGKLENGPVARLRLPTYIPPGLHGMFAEGLTFDF